MALNPNVVVVSPGDLITSTHLNNVRSNLDRIDVAAAAKVAKAGDTMTGDLLLGSGGLGAVGAGVGLNMPGQVKVANRLASTANAVLNKSSSAAAVGQGYVQFTYTEAGTVIGSINIASATSVVYGTTSDPRTKTAPPATRGISDASARVVQLGAAAWQGQHVDPATGDPEPGIWDFVSSHDVQDVAPYAVYGERDAVDETGAPVWQQVDFPALVPLLFAALSDALTRIAVLEGAGT